VPERGDSPAPAPGHSAASARRARQPGAPIGRAGPAARAARADGSPSGLIFAGRCGMLSAMDREPSDELRDLSEIVEVARELGSTIDLSTLLRRVESTARRAMGCERASVFLYDRPSDVLYSRVATGVEELRFSAKMGIAGEVARTGRSILVPDAYADPRFNRAVDEQTGYRTRNLLTFPLIGVDGGVVGVLQVLNKLNGAFTPADQAMADALSKLAGVAVQRQMLLDEYEIKRQIERDLEIARQIQQRLLPSRNPVVPGFDVAGWNCPADQTGGDCFDFIPMADGRLACLVADATGHGIGPALIVAQCRAMVRCMASVSGDLATIVNHVNRLLCDDLPDDRFVTAFIGVLDPATACLAYVSAGQGPLLHYRTRTDAAVALPATGLPMGIVPDQDFEAAEPLHLERGDMFALLTDGFFEWTDAADEAFGVGRVEEALRANREAPCAETIQDLYRRVRQFGGPTPQRDDLTAVLIKRL